MKSKIKIIREYSDDPADWEKAAAFLVEFAMKLIAKEEAEKTKQQQVGHMPSGEIAPE